MYVCMYVGVYVHVCMYVYVHVCMYVCVFGGVGVCVGVGVFFVYWSLKKKIFLQFCITTFRMK